MTAIEKTSKIVRSEVDINSLIPNDYNPNTMSEAEFNLLYDNIEQVGITDPILVVETEEPNKYVIVGGHHRWEVAKLHDFETVPVTILPKDDYDEDMQKFQMVRHNIIKGKMSPEKFVRLYQSLSEEYSEDVASELFGFSDEEEFRKLLKSTEKSLPKEMQKDFHLATQEIKSINDLATVLNRLFSTFGDTVPYNYMIFDYGGQDHIWIRMKKQDKKYLENLGDYTKKNNRTIDSLLNTILVETSKALIAGQENISINNIIEEYKKHPELSIEITEEKGIVTEEVATKLDNLLS